MTIVDDSVPAAPSRAADPNLYAPVTIVDDSVPAAPSRAADQNLYAQAMIVDVEPSFDNDPADRRLDRLLACLGLLDDPAPMFRPGTRVPGAGVLLALPAIEKSGVVEIAHDLYGSIGPAFYGLRTTIVAFVLLALLRIKRPEALKEHSPTDLGRILGLDRAPEVKTLRRKLARLASLGLAVDFGRALALLWQALFSVRSETQLVARLEFDMLARWFVGLPLDCSPWDHSTFSANRAHLRLPILMETFFETQLVFLREKNLLSSDHLTVDGTLIQAWASQKSMVKRSDLDSDGKPPAPPSG